MSSVTLRSGQPPPRTVSGSSTLGRPGDRTVNVQVSAMLTNEPKSDLQRLWHQTIPFLVVPFVISSITVLLVALFDRDVDPARRLLMGYFTIVVLLSFCTWMVVYRVFRRTSFCIVVRQREERFPGLLFFELCFLGWIPAFFLFGVMSHTCFYWYLAAMFLLALVVATRSRLNKGSSCAQSALTFLDVTTAAFYLGLIPFWLLSHFLGLVPRLYVYASETHGLSLGVFVAMAFILALVLVLNVMLLFAIGKARDLSGAYETSHRAKWVYVNTRESLRDARKWETGEWTPPMRTLPKFLLVNACALLLTLFAWSQLGAELPLNGSLSFLLAYTAFLVAFLVIYSMKASRNTRRP
jgi:hypothetical protein